ncbi:nonstructural protein NS3c [Pipistrellus abramus bat coronavirus HKU5-related]|nr:nonstructural protein NS3c [Pipistrellus abramus bat coronavirus HKU5-related]
MDDSMDLDLDCVIAQPSSTTVMMPLSPISTRKRRRHPMNKRRYAKRRFTPVQPNDIIMCEKPTHCIRLVFDQSLRWVHFDGIKNILSDYDVIFNPDLHVTVALVGAGNGVTFSDLTPLTFILADMLLEFNGIFTLGQTLVIGAREYHWLPQELKTNVGKAIPQAKEWLVDHGYNLYHTGLPTHMSLAKLHSLDFVQQSYVGSKFFIKHSHTTEYAMPVCLQVIAIDGEKVDGRSKPLFQYPIHNHYRHYRACFPGR